MKLKALKKVWYRNTTRGCMESLAVGQEFELMPKEDSQQIFELICNLAAVPIDSDFIPPSSKYLAITGFSYQLNGKKVEVKQGDSLTLIRDQAAEFMARGYVRPSDLNQWSIKKLLEPTFQPDERVKKMFDDLPPKERPENWATKGVKR
jgi:hypothetical protein